MYKKICITDRKLIRGDFVEGIKKILASDVDIVILREKDMRPDAYEVLAKMVIDLCDTCGKTCVLHYFTDVALTLGHPYIHLPMDRFVSLSKETKERFSLIGVSTHGIDEAKEAERLGASYITASHIFPTECKKGLTSRGLEFLKEICSSVTIPVYALGGIKPGNIDDCIKNGASGVCMMSYYMNLGNEA